MTSSDDEARRTLEQRALRNVRGLVDKMEQTDALDNRSQKRTLLAIALGAVVVMIAIGAVLLFKGERRDAVPIDTAKLPPVKAGPPQK